MDKKWVYKNNDENLVSTLISEYKMTPLAARVFQNRLGIVSNDLTKLKGTAKGALYNPFLMKGMDLAVNRIKRAIEAKEKIAIFGDYDADGITSTAILYTYLKNLTNNICYYIPDRISDGYGININSIDKFLEDKVSLIITVDNGIAAIDEILYATKLGIDVIVTDHHECKDKLPCCCAVINPKQKDCNYPFKELSGVGVAFKLICALSGGDISDALKVYSPLVSIGTIADIVPLVDENRALVKFGLKYFKMSGNRGIDSMINSCKLSDKEISVGDIGFNIAPRINAVGRIDDSSMSLKLFLSDDTDYCMDIAKKLNDINTKRQQIEKTIFEKACELIERNELYKEKFILLASNEWHTGVIGIVASKIVEKYFRPTVLLSIDGDISKGSGRSIFGFNLFEALQNTSDKLIKFGGHEMAAGLSLKTENINSFYNSILEYANEKITEDDLIPTVLIDCELNSNDISIETIKGLDFLKPFGVGNQTPVFALNNVTVKSVSTMTEGKHIKFKLIKDNKSITAVGFGLGELSDYIEVGDTLNVAGNAEINTYCNFKSIQFIIKDIKLLAKGRG